MSNISRAKYFNAWLNPGRCATSYWSVTKDGELSAFSKYPIEYGRNRNKYIPAIGTWVYPFKDWTVRAHLSKSIYAMRVNEAEIWRIFITDADDGCIDKEFNSLEDALGCWNTLELKSKLDLIKDGFTY